MNPSDQPRADPGAHAIVIDSVSGAVLPDRGYCAAAWSAPVSATTVRA